MFGTYVLVCSVFLLSHTVSDSFLIFLIFLSWNRFLHPALCFLYHCKDLFHGSRLVFITRKFIRISSFYLFIKRLLFILRILWSSTLTLWAPFSALTGSKTSVCHPHRISSTSDPHPIRIRSVSVFYICNLSSSSNACLFTAMFFLCRDQLFPTGQGYLSSS